MLDIQNARQKIDEWIDTSGASVTTRFETRWRVSGLNSVAAWFLYVCLAPESETKKSPFELLGGDFVMNIFNAIVPPRDREKPVPFMANELREKMVLADTLQDQEFVWRVTYTVYRMLWEDDLDSALAFINGVEEVSDGTMIFPGFTPPLTQLYERFYLLVVCRYFFDMYENSKKWFLSSSLALTAVRFGYDLEEMVAKHIKASAVVETRQALSLDYAASLAINETVLGKDESGLPWKVKDWIEQIRSLISKSANLDEFLKNINADKDVSFQTEPDKNSIIAIARLYFALVAGDFIVEEKEQPIVQEVTEHREKTTQPNSSPQSFIEEIKKHQNDFAEWITSDAAHGSVRKWLGTFASPHEASGELVSLINSSVPAVLNDIDKATAILSLSEFLQDNQLIERELVYWGESDGQFHWNEELIK